MIEHSGSHLRFLVTGELIERVIDDKNVSTILAGQRLEEVLDDRKGKQRRKTKPVDTGIILF